MRFGRLSRPGGHTWACKTWIELSKEDTNALRTHLMSFELTNQHLGRRRRKAKGKRLVSTILWIILK